MKRPEADGSVPALSVILPASNEAGLIGSCLRAVLASDWSDPAPVEVIVVANGCTDDTAERARAMADAFAARGWSLTVIDRPEGGKTGALNAGDAVARSGNRAYLDADVTVSPALLSQAVQALRGGRARFVSGTVNLTANRSAFSRAYARIWRQVPFMAEAVPGCGFFAVNEAGRARWGDFPDIISDDTFVRLSFTPKERVAVPAVYDWPIVEGLANLVKVRRRQNRGVDEIARRFPDLLRNDDDRPFPLRRKLALALRDPAGFAVYSGVALICKLAPGRGTEWSRGR